MEDGTGFGREVGPYDLENGLQGTCKRSGILRRFVGIDVTFDRCVGNVSLTEMPECLLNQVIICVESGMSVTEKYIRIHSTLLTILVFSYEFVGIEEVPHVLHEHLSLGTELASFRRRLDLCKS